MTKLPIQADLQKRGGGVGYDGIRELAHRPENVHRRTPGRNHREETLLVVDERFGARVRGDVGEQHASAQDAALGIA